MDEKKPSIKSIDDAFYKAIKVINNAKDYGEISERERRQISVLLRYGRKAMVFKYEPHTADDLVDSEGFMEFHQRGTDEKIKY